ncbi:MAG: VOC family protein [Bacteroidales bacterium]|nr:VOC family protein [Bacteroidales bacterium]
MLQHIAITINDSEEIENFYEDVLQCRLKHKFKLNREISRQIFNKDAAPDIYVMVLQDSEFEIFLSSGRERKEYSHICLAYPQSEEIYRKAAERGYKTLIKKNPVNDTYFIWDRSGNLFEIKKTPA